MAKKTERGNQTKYQVPLPLVMADDDSTHDENDELMCYGNFILFKFIFTNGYFIQNCLGIVPTVPMNTGKDPTVIENGSQLSKSVISTPLSQVVADTDESSNER